MQRSQFTYSAISDRYHVWLMMRSYSALDSSGLSFTEKNTKRVCFHLFRVSSPPQLDWELQLYVPQEDSAQVLTRLSGDPCYHLTGCADHHPLRAQQTQPRQSPVNRQTGIVLYLWWNIFIPTVFSFRTVWLQVHLSRNDKNLNLKKNLAKIKTF